MNTLKLLKFYFSELVFSTNHGFYVTFVRKIAVYVDFIMIFRDVSTIPDKIFGTKWSNPVKLDRRRKVWYLFLRVFYLLLAKSKLLKGD